MRRKTINRKSLIAFALQGLFLALFASTASAQITRSDMVMWDYRANGTASLSTYHHWLLGYCQAHPPKRLILYVSDPRASTEFCTFYDPGASPDKTAATMNFVGFIKNLENLPIPDPIELEIMIDRSSFQHDQTGTCTNWNGSPGNATVNGIHPPALAQLWTGLPYAMAWYKDLLDNPEFSGGSPISGVTMDPEFHDPTDPLAGERGYIANMIWMDMFHVANGITDQRIGITLGVDAHTVAKALVNDFPMYTKTEFPSAPTTDVAWSIWKCNKGCSGPDPSLCQWACDLDGFIVNAPSGGPAPSGVLNYRPGQNDPIVDSIYMQVYYGCEPNTNPPGAGYWQWICKDGCDTTTTPSPRDVAPPATTVPETSATILARTLRREPALPGPVGAVITAVVNPTLSNPATANDQHVCTAPGGVNLTGTNTDFRLWPADARVHLIDPSTGAIVPPEPQEWKNFHPWAPNLPPMDVCHEPWPQTDATHISLNGAQVSQATALPYQITELVMDYRVPGVTQQMSERFWFMFSAEQTTNTPFFGYWSWGDFSSFVNEFDTLAKGSLKPFATPTAAPQSPIAFPSQFAIYDMGNAINSWGSAFWNGAPYPGVVGESPCPGDFNGDNVVNGTDLGSMLAAWQSDSAECDLNDDAWVDAEDLGLLLTYWGQCP